LRISAWQSLTKQRQNWELRTFVQTNIPKLVPNQRIAYDRIRREITSKSGGMYSLDAFGGTGKTSLIPLILATIRSQNNISFAIASSGIAATFLHGCRTVHSALKLPMNMQICETPTCNINKIFGMRKILKSCQHHMGKYTIAHKKEIEALCQTIIRY